MHKEQMTYNIASPNHHEIQQIDDECVIENNEITTKNDILFPDNHTGESLISENDFDENRSNQKKSYIYGIKARWKVFILLDMAGFIGGVGLCVYGYIKSGGFDFKFSKTGSIYQVFGVSVMALTFLIALAFFYGIYKNNHRKPAMPGKVSDKKPLAVAFTIAGLLCSIPMIIDLSCDGKIIKRDIASIVCDVIFLVAWLFIKYSDREETRDVDQAQHIDDDNPPKLTK